MIACWVCKGPIRSDERSVPATGVPRRHRASEGKLVHLRCHGEWPTTSAPPKRKSEVARERAAGAGPFLFARDVARLRNITVRRARRWLQELDEKFGSALVGRVGNRRYTTTAALADVGPRPDRGAEAFEALARRVAALEARVFPDRIENLSA